MNVAVGLDVGGSSVKAVTAVLEHGRPRALSAPVTREHGGGRDAGELRDTVLGLARELAAEAPQTPVAWGVAAAAWIDPGGHALFSPHLPAWRDLDLPSALTDPDLGRPLVTNDADAAAWAEARTGAQHSATGTRTVFVGIGTGIGGALVVDGRLERGAHGIAGEYGHLTIDPDAGPCVCGNVGCWELLVSAERLTALSGVSPPARVIDAALAGEPDAVAAVETLGADLGKGLATVAAVLDPDRFVIGGGVALTGEILLAPARQVLAQRIPGGRGGHRPVPAVEVARLGNAAGALGAAGMALEALAEETAR